MPYSIYHIPYAPKQCATRPTRRLNYELSLFSGTEKQRPREREKEREREEERLAVNGSVENICQVREDRRERPGRGW